MSSQLTLRCTRDQATMSESQGNQSPRDLDPKAIAILELLGTEYKIAMTLKDIKAEKEPII